MTIVLRLLGEVSYDGEPVAGARSADLLAALAQQPAGVSDARLVEEIWGDHPPAAPAKALQVQVSRVRSQCGAAVIDRYDGGYRMGLDDEAVDAWWAGVLAHRARERWRATSPERWLMRPLPTRCCARRRSRTATGPWRCSGPAPWPWGSA